MFVDGFSDGATRIADEASGRGSARAPTTASAAGVGDATAGVASALDDDRVFDGHVLACLVAVASEEAAGDPARLGAALGLDGARLAPLLATYCPDFDRAGLGLERVRAPEPEIEEELLRDLLLAHGAGRDDGFGAALAAMIARRALRPDHLWQDLGLADRSELNRLLARHFPSLHAGNTANMRWKKYFYRKLCEAEGFSLCAAPSCAQCADFASCFGAEDGESRMAATRRAFERAEAGATGG